MTSETPPIDRPAARLVVVDEVGSVLLSRVVVDGGEPFWLTPGGGIEPGESLVEAAARELREETGLVVGVDMLGAPVAQNHGPWTFRGLSLYAQNWYFALRVPRFQPSDDGLDDVEREITTGWRWWSPDELDRTEERIVPPGLADLARTIAIGETGGDPVVELPWLT